MNNGIKIERMTKEDILFYAQELKIFDDEVWNIELLNEFSNDPFAYFFKAHWNEEFAGYCAVYHNTLNTRHFCKIMDLEVIEAMRRKGVGKALMYKIIELSQELELNQIKLEVETKNSIALQMYKSLGFQIERTEKEYYNDGADAYIMMRSQEDKPFLYDVLDLVLSQIYISKQKLDDVYKWFNGSLDSFKPISVRDFNGDGKLTITDGHTRAFAAWKAEITQIPILIDNDEIYNQEETIKEYLMCIDWCNLFGLKNVADLDNRILSEKDYKILWDLRCDRMQHLIAALVNGVISEQAVKSIQNKIKQQGLLIYGVSEDLLTFYCDDQYGKSFLYQQETLIEEIDF